MWNLGENMAAQYCVLGNRGLKPAKFYFLFGVWKKGNTECVVYSHMSFVFLYY